MLSLNSVQFPGSPIFCCSLNTGCHHIQPVPLILFFRSTPFHYWTYIHFVLVTSDQVNMHVFIFIFQISSLLDTMMKEVGDVKEAAEEISELKRKLAEVFLLALNRGIKLN